MGGAAGKPVIRPVAGGGMFKRREVEKDANHTWWPSWDQWPVKVLRVEKAATNLLGTQQNNYAVIVQTSGEGHRVNTVISIIAKDELDVFKKIEAYNRLHIARKEQQA